MRGFKIEELTLYVISSVVEKSSRRRKKIIIMRLRLDLSTSLSLPQDDEVGVAVLLWVILTRYAIRMTR